MSADLPRKSNYVLSGSPVAHRVPAVNEPPSPDPENFGGFTPPRPGGNDGPEDGPRYFNAPPPELNQTGRYYAPGDRLPDPSDDFDELYDAPVSYPASSGSSEAAEALFIVFQLLFYLCAAFIFLNALAQTVLDGDWGLFTVEIIFAPFTVLLYPLFASTDAVAWPFSSPAFLFYAWLLGIAAFALSWLMEKISK